VRAILVTIRYPDRRAINAQDCQTAPTMGVNLLTSMPCHKGIEQVVEWGDPQSVAGLYQARRTDGRLADMIRKNQLQMVAYGLNRPVTQEGHAKHQPHHAFCGKVRRRTEAVPVASRACVTNAASRFVANVLR